MFRKIFKNNFNEEAFVNPTPATVPAAPVATAPTVSPDTVPTNLTGFRFNSVSNVGDGVVLATVKLRDLISGMKEGYVVDYEKNRGNGKLNSSKVKTIAANYDINKLGIITIADFGNGLFKKADAHHRSAAILMKNDGVNGFRGFSNTELDQEVSLHVIPKEDFIRVYSGLNSNNGHSSRQKVLNTDLGLGKLIQDILDLQEKETSVQEKFYTTIARCVYAYTGQMDLGVKQSSYADISLDRRVVSDDAGLSKADFDVKVTKTQKEEIAEALDYVNETYLQFRNLNNLNSGTKNKSVKLNATGRSIMSNASLFGFILWDRLSGRKYITGLTAKNLALRITEKDAQIERQAKDILNSVSRDNAADKIVQYICTKKRK